MRLDLIISNTIALGAVSIAVAVVVVWRRARGRPSTWIAIGGFALAYVAHSVVLALPQAPLFDELRYNWQNKLIVAAVIAALLVRCSPEFRDRAGFGSPRGAWIVFGAIGSIAILAIAIIAGLAAGPPQPLELETILFQAIVPGLDEELLYRGLLWALLAIAFHTRSRAAEWTPLALTTLLFALAHGVEWHDGHAGFLAGPFLTSLIVGFWLGWTRLYTGSIVPGMFLHNAYNVIFSVLASY